MPSATTHKGEPALQDLINDPIIKLLMQKDGVEQDNLRDLLQKAADRLKKSQPTQQ